MYMYREYEYPKRSESLPPNHWIVFLPPFSPPKSSRYTACAGTILVGTPCSFLGKGTPPATKGRVQAMTNDWIN